MLDKRAKRYARRRRSSSLFPLPTPPPLPTVRATRVRPRAHSVFISDASHNSALSLRIFGEDITSAARDAAAKKKQKSEATPDAVAVVDAAAVLEDENADASDLPEASGVADEE